MTSISNLQVTYFINSCKNYNKNHPDPKIKGRDIDAAAQTANRIYLEAKEAPFAKIYLNREGFSLDSIEKLKFITGNNLKDPYWKDMYHDAVLLGIMASKKEVKVIEPKISEVLKNKEGNFKTTIAALKVAGYILSQNKEEICFTADPNIPLPLYDVFAEQLNNVKDDEFNSFINSPKPDRPVRKDLPSKPPKSNSSPLFTFRQTEPPGPKSKSLPEMTQQLSLKNEILSEKDFIETVTYHWLIKDERTLEIKKVELQRTLDELKKQNADTTPTPKVIEHRKRLRENIENLKAEITRLGEPILIDGLSSLGNTPEEVGRFLFKIYQEGKNKQDPFVIFNLSGGFSIDTWIISKEDPVFLYGQLAFLLGVAHSKKEIHIPYEGNSRSLRASFIATKKNGGSSIRNFGAVNQMGHLVSACEKMGYYTEEESDKHLMLKPGKNCEVATIAELKRKALVANLKAILDFLKPPSEK